jgi:hypothetical protein
MVSNRWKVAYRKHGRGYWEGALIAYWDVAGDWMSDDYTPDEADAETLFRRWSKRAMEEFPSGLVPINWYVSCDEQIKFEAMPFQYREEGERPRDDFLTYYEWPVHPVTGERLNWFTLPVEDKLWNDRRADKGGFIQELTGWKPSILQPFVYLPSLIRATLERLPNYALRPYPASSPSYGLGPSATVQCKKGKTRLEAGRAVVRAFGASRQCVESNSRRRAPFLQLPCRGVLYLVAPHLAHTNALVKLDNLDTRRAVS